MPTYKQSELKVTFDELMSQAYILGKAPVWKKSQAGMFYWYVDEFLDWVWYRYICKWLKQMPWEYKNYNIQTQYVDSYSEKLLY